MRPTEPAAVSGVVERPADIDPAKSRPVSARKRVANRANAARSTGPRTTKGKDRAKMNAVRHGLTAQAVVLPGEDAREWAALAQHIEADLKPHGTLERELVSRVAVLSWRLRRVGAAEQTMWENDNPTDNHGIA